MPEANPNGSVGNIAGVMNRQGTIFGLMPHPEAASEKLLGSDDGLYIFRAMLKPLTTNRAQTRNSGLFNTNADEVDLAYTSPEPGPRI